MPLPGGSRASGLGSRDRARWGARLLVTATLALFSIIGAAGRAHAQATNDDVVAAVDALRRQVEFGLGLLLFVTTVYVLVWLVRR